MSSLTFGARDAMLAGIVGWTVFVVISAFGVVMSLVFTVTGHSPREFQYDWHVYAGGGRDLLEGTLYRVPLTLEDLPLPVTVFNQPPAIALWAVPLLWLPISVGGLIWQTLSVASLALGSLAAVASTGIRRPWVWVGIGLALYAVSYLLRGILVANINFLMTALYGAFLLTYASSRDRSAGMILGIAIATKLWPAALVIVLIRDRRWTVVRWAVGVTAAQAIMFLIWLGPDVIKPMLAALVSHVPVTSAVFGLSALREIYDWWPGWIAPLLALLLIVVPARGLVGIGLATIGILSAIPNLWHHYLPTVALAAIIVCVGANPPSRWSWFRPTNVARMT